MLKFNQAKTDELKELIQAYDKDHKLNQQSSPKFIAQVKSLLADGADPAVSINEINNTPLLTAILKGDIALCECLIEADKDGQAINKKDTYEGEAGNTPLILAIKRGLYDIALLLIKHGAKVNEPSGFQGYTALHFATALLGIQYQRQETSRSDFHAKAEDPIKKLIELIERLVSAGANVTAENEFGMTPLAYLSHEFTEDEIQTSVYEPTSKMIFASRAKVSLELASVYSAKKQKYTNEFDQFEADGEAQFDKWIAKHEHSIELQKLRQADKEDEAINRERVRLQAEFSRDKYDEFIKQNADHFALMKPFYAEELPHVLEKFCLPEISLHELITGLYVLKSFTDLEHSHRNHAESIYSAVCWHRDDNIRDGLIYRRKEYFDDNTMVPGKLKALFTKVAINDEIPVSRQTLVNHNSHLQLS